MNEGRSITVQDLAAWRADPNRSAEIVVLDVREPVEVEIATLPDTLRIPMRQIPERCNELDREKTTVVL